MTSDAKTPTPEPKEHVAPKGSSTQLEWKNSRGESVAVLARSEWILLRKKEKPSAEIFHTHYRLKNASGPRPLTFVFNGGPGAASAYLHLGALGPVRIAFEETGAMTAPPVRLVNNTESWIEFTDLVFIDPVGTGFSRMVEAPPSAPDKDKKDAAPAFDEKEYYQLNRDIEAFGEFVERFLSQHKLWNVPIHLAGESYGGYRTAKLARTLQEKHGVGLTSVIAISPALEWSLLNPSDYGVLHYIDSFCSMALAAAFHGKSKLFSNKDSIESMRRSIETFASQDLAYALIAGTHHDETTLTKTYKKLSDYLGLPQELVKRARGRIPIERFVRELLREARTIVGLYDATITATDPFPDRDQHQAPDPTLAGISRVFGSGINQYLRSQIGVDTNRIYDLLSENVNASWKRDDQKHVFDLVVGATDDLRFAMSMNPHMKVLITHGYYDLVTPYFSSERLVEQMMLLPTQRSNLHIRHFEGGHMFYSWDQSRRDFTDWVRTFY